MRLINTTTIQLHEFFDDQIPLYAILSHRWEGAEVTFQDLGNGTGVQMKGYAKILRCCAQARKDGFEFAWIDSCCIDKSSSAELSEAINSMFQWYKNAQVCYAYLSDVPVGEDLDHYRYGSEFRRSEWFTRGWTLQELLAPEIVVFYNHNWIEIGTRAFMADLVSSITNIDVGTLKGYIFIKRTSVATRMSWASKRKTTRLEDTAYCLMGLFDVNMPLLYGEGRKAFYRLQLEIIKNCEDESIFAWGREGTNIVPDIEQTQFYGLLAENPGMFQDCGDIVPHCPCDRPPYTMTNKGLQIMAKLVSPSKYMAVAGVLEDNGEYPKWILSLHCSRGEQNSNSLAIYLLEDTGGRGWTRVSDLLLSSRDSEHWKAIHSDGSNERQIIIQAEPEYDEYDDLLFSKRIPFMLDASSIVKYGYSVRVQVNNDPPFELGKAGRYITQLESDSPKFSLLCERPGDNFHLIMTGELLSNRVSGCFISLDDGDEPKYLYKWVRLPSGKVAKVVLKRKAESGKPIYVGEILIVERLR